MPRPAQPDDDTTREILHGFIRIHILHHAAVRPVYGLWLIEELAEHGYRMSAGTLYPILHTLARRGLLSSRERLAGGKIRKYYSITPQGRKALTQMRRKLGELVSEVLPSRATRNP